MVLTLGWILIVAAFVYYLPGRLAVLFLLRDELPEERFVLSFASGLLLVNVTSLLVAGLRDMLTNYSMTRSLVLAVSAAWAVTFGILVVWRRRDRIREFFMRPTRRQAAIWIWTAAVSLLFAVNFHRAQTHEDSCIIRAATAVVIGYGRSELLEVPGEDGLTEYQKGAIGFQTGNTPFITDNQSQRLGPTVMVAPALALFGPLGLRLVYLLQGLLLPGLGLVLGLRLLSTRWAPWLVAILLPMSPYAMNIHVVDENFISSIFGTLMLVCLLRPRPSWVLAGMALSLFLGIRHVGVLMVPAVFAYIVMAAPERRRALLSFSGALSVFGLPYIIMHLFLFLQQGHLFEGAMNRPPMDYSFLGLRFSLPVLLNFPFVESLLRSPYAAYPPLIEVPLDFIRRHGLLLSALVIPGLFRFSSFPLPRRVLIAGWVVPLWCLVLVQSNWTEPNKMGVPASVLAPLLLVMAAGAEWLVDRGVTWRRRSAVAVLGLFVPLALFLGLRTIRTDVDARIFLSIPDYVDEFYGKGTVLWNAETPEYLEFERSRNHLALLPDIVPDPCRTGYAGYLLADMGKELASPTFAEWTAQPMAMMDLAVFGRTNHLAPFALARQIMAGELNSDWLSFRTCSDSLSADETVEVTLNLVESPTTGDSLFLTESAEGGAEIDLSESGWHIIRGINVPFAEEPVTVVIGRGCDGLMAVYFAPRGLSEVRLDIPGLRMTRVPSEAVKGLRVRTIVPRDSSLLVTDVRTLNPKRTYQRMGTIEDGIVRLGPPRPQ